MVLNHIDCVSLYHFIFIDYFSTEEDVTGEPLGHTL